MNIFGWDYGHGTQSDANKIKKGFFFQRKGTQKSKQERRKVNFILFPRYKEYKF